MCDFWHKKTSYEPFQQTFFFLTNWVSGHVLGLRDIDGDKTCTLPSPCLKEKNYEYIIRITSTASEALMDFDESREGELSLLSCLRKR